jgi:hypothetical protein
MDEAGHKRNLVKEVNALPGGYARRAEDKYAVGVLDLIIKLPGRPILWAEGKMIDGFKFYPTLRQFEEGNRIIQANMRAVLIGWKSQRMYISPWKIEADCRSCFSGSDHYATVQEYLDALV